MSDKWNENVEGVRDSAADFFDADELETTDNGLRFHSGEKWHNLIRQSAEDLEKLHDEC